MKALATCCFVGHSPKSLSFGFDEESDNCMRLKQLIKEQVIYLIEDFGVSHFISGVDLGISQYAAEIVLALKRDYPEITLECIIPSENHATKWMVAQRERYFSILERCDKETLLQRHHTKDCMKKRNNHIISQSTYVLAVWNGRPGGTRNIVSIAHQMEKTVIVIDPNTFEVHSYFCKQK